MGSLQKLAPAYVVFAGLMGCGAASRPVAALCLLGPASPELPRGPLVLGDSLQLRAGSVDSISQCGEKAPSDVAWSSSDTTVFTVSAAGFIAAQRAGTASVVVQSGDHQAVHTITVIESLPPDVIPTFESITLTSRVLGEKRLINVHLPGRYASDSAASWPVLYMPDGAIDEDFPHVVNTVDSLVALKMIRPVIIVGIPNVERRKDLTSPTSVKADSEMVANPGGAANFRRFIGEELIPAIESRFRTTEERSLVGESLAGLFVMEFFLREPERFDHYISLDPSLWWNNGALVTEAPALLASFDTSARSIYFANSNVEEMVEGTAKIASHLTARALSGLRWRHENRPDLRHHNIFRALAPAAFIHALR